MTITFYCDRPPTTGGETPIADCRRICARLRPAIRERFAELGVTYVRNLRGRSELESVFGTADPLGIAAYCAAHDYAVTFAGEDRVRTERVAPAIVEHPVTGEKLWFNNVGTCHRSSPDWVPKRNSAAGDDGPAMEVRYGDGSPINHEVAREIRRACAAETVAFPWQRGDVLVLDNMLIAHGRRPFTRDRRILVSMGDSHRQGPGAGR